MQIHSKHIYIKSIVDIKSKTCLNKKESTFYLTLGDFRNENLTFIAICI